MATMDAGGPSFADFMEAAGGGDAPPAPAKVFDAPEAAGSGSGGKDLELDLEEEAAEPASRPPEDPDVLAALQNWAAEPAAAGGEAGAGGRVMMAAVQKRLQASEVGRREALAHVATLQLELEASRAEADRHRKAGSAAMTKLALRKGLAVGLQRNSVLSDAARHAARMRGPPPPDETPEQGGCVVSTGSAVCALARHPPELHRNGAEHGGRRG